MSTLALAGLLREAAPALEAALGARLEVELAPTKALEARIRAGEHADAAVLTAEAVAALSAEGVLDGMTARPLAHSRVGLAVKAGAPHPDIGSVEALRRTLLSVPSLCYSRAGASGIFFAGLIERLGIAAEVNAKAIVIPQGFTAEKLVNGEAAIAFQQISELMEVPGIEIVGALPEGAQTVAVFSGAAFTGAANGTALLDAVARVCTPAALRAKGLDAPG
ncbi:substrate-binding domain-containing protein [Neoroseomonas lacus]|uniref:Molybdate ABC transporter substrate-binding protein n=1 Tax=Neoroseomonas lacus TaxID=287609 RepID=A0A917KXS3_9PROT|nr:substrate-binding domain-containing protein [Neoroseomonas lacus]GGJ34987.1 molybdate ABC transporter substrate-binding protein [Neoroseomonas lacus]